MLKMTRLKKLTSKSCDTPNVEDAQQKCGHDCYEPHREQMLLEEYFEEHPRPSPVEYGGRHHEQSPRLLDEKSGNFTQRSGAKSSFSDET